MWKQKRFLVLSVLALGLGSAARIATLPVSYIRVPNGGIQPQVVEQDGIVHLLYFSGEPEHGDLSYVQSRDYGRTFSAPLKVNSNPGSAIAVGNMRGGQLAIGRNGRVHVAWYGSSAAKLRSADNRGPMLYARLNDAGTAFEPERNLITSAWGMDGGTLAADAQGGVFVFWHAPQPGKTGEENRRVWMAKSTDDGKTFAPETVASDQPIGVCGCCGLRAFAGSDGVLRVLFRSATETVHRDMYLLTSKDRGRTFASQKVSEWNIGACVMSTEAFAQSATGTLAAWETEKQVYFGKVNGGAPIAIGAPGTGENRKYPSLAINSRGETLFTWTENMAWKKGGTVAWQLYDRDLKPEGAVGRADGVPVWSLVAAFAKPDGSFAVIY
jgi:hypothetical protein